MRTKGLGRILLCLGVCFCLCACGKVHVENEDSFVKKISDEFLEMVQIINDNSDMGLKLWEIVDSTDVKGEHTEDHDMEYPDDVYTEDGSACGTYCVDPMDEKTYRICQILILKDTRNVLGTKIGDDMDSVERQLEKYDFIVDEETKTHRFAYYRHKTQNIHITYKFPGGKVTYINIGASPDNK